MTPEEAKKKYDKELKYLLKDIPDAYLVGYELGRASVVEEKKKLIEKIKRYWFYAGEFHDAGCESILYDRGICNCDLTKIKDEIK